MIGRKVIIFAGILISVAVFGQKTKEQLQKENADLKKQIETINQDLAKTQSEARLSVAYLNSVNNKIALREKVYNNTQKEKKLIEDDIYLRQLEINKQNRELDVLRKNYAEVLVKAYKNRGVQNRVVFILSSKSLGEAIRRVKYLKQYSDYQNKKSVEISEKVKEIKNSIALREKSVTEKNNLLASQQKELVVINGEKQQKEDLVAEFKKNEAKLTAELKKKQAQSKALDGQIRAIIAEEMRLAKIKEENERKAREENERLAKIAAEKEKARIDAENRAKLAAAEEARKKADAEAKKLADIAAKKLESDAKDAAAADAKAKEAADKAAAAKAAAADLAKKNEDAKKAAETQTMTNFGVSTASGNNFSDYKGKIAMPVSGNITHYFGRQPHPVFKNITEENSGIKIAVSPGTKAKCVFSGTVTRIIVTGDTKTVVVSHGDYFTVYSNLSSAGVSQGQKIVAGTIVGEVGQEFDGSTTLDFQIWNSKTNPPVAVDPLQWVNN